MKWVGKDRTIPVFDIYLTLKKKKLSPTVVFIFHSRMGSTGHRLLRSNLKFLNFVDLVEQLLQYAGLSL